MSFTIAIIGRPNVGKSTLFNKLVGKSFAIVDDTPGVTRDRKEAMARLGPIEFKVVDTAGLEKDILDDDLETRMVNQTNVAAMDADLCIFVVDYKSGVMPDDFHFATWIKNNKIPAILVVNKCDNHEGEVFDKEYYRLAMGQAVGISAEHKGGFNLLYDLIEPYYAKYKEAFGAYEEDLETSFDKENFVQIAIIGRPNSGKSTFLNKLIGKDRLITGPEAGITRDAISLEWQFEGHEVRLIDTAGIRKKGNVDQKLEQLSLLDSFRAMRYAQIVVILIDVEVAFDHQDLAIANMAIKEGRGIVFAINKFDLVKNKKAILDELKYKISKSLPDVVGAPLIALSALTGDNVVKVMQEAIKVYKQWQMYISTTKLNEWIRFAEESHAPIMVKGKPAKLKYITQAKKRPPTFVLFTNYPKAIKGAYERYLINSLRQFFNLKLIPIRLLIRKSENPFEGVKYKKFSKKSHEKTFRRPDNLVK
jgi:GTP-binding protein